MALAYNLPDFEGELRLSRQAYAGIFLGQIKNWNDPQIAKTNPGKKLPNLTIATVVRQDGSGTTFAFTKHLDAISETLAQPIWTGHAGELAGKRDASAGQRGRRRAHQAIDRLDRLRQLRVCAQIETENRGRSRTGPDIM